MSKRLSLYRKPYRLVYTQNYPRQISYDKIPPSSTFKKGIAFEALPKTTILMLLFSSFVALINMSTKHSFVKTTFALDNFMKKHASPENDNIK